MRTTEWNDDRATVLGRAVRILDAFGAGDSDRDGLGPSELARRTGLPKTTVHRLAGELARLGLLESSGSGFRPGLHLFELGALATRQRTLREAARPIMDDLRTATGKTVHLAVLEGSEVVYVEIVAAPGTLRLPSRVGGRMPAHATGVGKAILAFSDVDRVEAVLAGPLERRAPRTLTAPGQLRSELARIRERGLSFDREESAVGVLCVASPVWGQGGHVVAALSISGRVEQVKPDVVAPAVRTAALAVSRALGYRPVGG